MPKRSSPSSIRSSFDESRTGPRRPGGRRPRLPSSCSGAAASSTARTAVAFWDDTWLEKDLALTLSSTNQSSRSTKAFSGAGSRFPIQRHQGAGKGLAQQSEERSDLTPCLLNCRETETETKLNILLPGNRCKLQEQGPAEWTWRPTLEGRATRRASACTTGHRTSPGPSACGS